jgi:hypothetical protein
MGKNVADLRFGIQRPDGYISSIWRMWATKSGCVYLATVGMAQHKKYSFHQSGISKDAFTKETWGNRTDDKATSSWRRGELPVQGYGKATVLGSIEIPTALLSRNTLTLKKKIRWLEAAPVDGATVVEFLLTHESESTVKSLLSTLPERTLLYYKKLPDGKSLAVTYFHGEWEQKIKKMGADPKSVIPEAIIFSTLDSHDTGRPLRVTMSNMPKDYDPLLISDMGGYKEIQFVVT